MPTIIKDNIEPRNQINLEKLRRICKALDSLFLNKKVFSKNLRCIRLKSQLRRKQQIKTKLTSATTVTILTIMRLRLCDR